MKERLKMIFDRISIFVSCALSSGYASVLWKPFLETGACSLIVPS